MHSIWQGIFSRCYKPRTSQYEYYGGQDIELLWESWEQFYTDMCPTYFEGASLGRRDTKKDFSSDNCYWATRTDLTRNRSGYNVRVKLGRKIVLLAELVANNRSEIVCDSTLRTRLKAGWDLERSKTQPLRSRKTVY